MNTPGTFQIHATDGAARTGVLQTAHGPVNTPIFMPVGTVGSVKAIAPDDLNAIGAEIILGNTYHLYLRPGDELVARRGGLHGFNAWDKPILTDSGGFQVFSLSTLRTIKEEGVTFRSHLDGSKHLFTPEKVVSIQRNLNSDIMMVLDECVPAGADHTYTARSLTMTTRWAKRCRDAYPKGTAGNLLFGIVQGGMFKDLRSESARQLINLDFEGYAIGGLSVGESKDVMMEMLYHTAPILPSEKPRYLMGVGTPLDIIKGIDAGVDMFDCVLPTRNARNGTLYTSLGKLNIKRREFAEDARWALAHPERVSAVTVYGGGTSEPNDATRALEAAGASFVYGTEQVEGAYDVCVTCPGISEFSGFFKAGREHAAQIMGEPEFAYRLSPDNWIAITGTNGKTTTTSLTDYLLKASGEASVAVGNIGEPPINEIDGRAHNEWFVAELSSYQIATTTELHPRVAVLLNITPDHLGWHKSHKNYALAKIKLFENMVDDDLVVIDVEDAGIHEFDEYIYTPGRRICKVAFDEPEGADAAFVRDGKMIVRLKGVETQLVATSELKISGHHNVINALCAATAALAVGADPEGICRGLASFQPLEHRVEPCGEIDGVRYVNDSKATNTDAVEKALTAFPDDDVILLLGGHDKGTPLTDFARVVMDNVRSVVCFGDARERFTAAMDEADVDGDVDIAQADDLRDAVDVARSLSSRGDVILLSPACSSFDEFSGYEERGRVFKDYVAQLAAAAKSQME